MFSEEQVERIKAQFRFKDGSLRHAGDCRIYGPQICTCGLIHTLQIDFEHAVILYPKFADELGPHENALDEAFFWKKIRQTPGNENDKDLPCKSPSASLAAPDTEKAPVPPPSKPGPPDEESPSR